MEVKKNVKHSNWLVLMVICFTAAVIMELPYLRWALYEPLREGLGQTHTQFGMSMSLFGTIAAVAYIPGGMLADRFSHRKLFAVSSIACGLLGFWFATLPSFAETMIIHALWSITNILMFWPVMTKAISLLADKKNQGKMFGLFEGIRGVIIVVMMAALLQVFEKFGGISAVIIGLAIGSIVCGIVAFIFMEDNLDTNTKSENSVLKDMLSVVKMPTVWIIGGVIFMIYVTYSSSSYMTPYVQNILGVSAMSAGYISILRKDVIRIIAAPLSGYLSVKLDGACTKVIAGFAVLMLLSIIGLVMLPPATSYITLVVIIMLVSSFAIYGMRGMYYAIIGEIGTPKKIYGAVAGWAMFIGFLPDAYNATFCGYLLDKFPGVQGYHYIFYYMITTLSICLVLVFVLLRIVNKYNASKKLIAENGEAV